VVTLVGRGVFPRGQPRPIPGGRRDPSVPKFFDGVTEMLLLFARQVCAEQQCEDEVFPLSVNYLDRVLSTMPVRRSQLQLLAAVSMFIASKFKDTTPLSAHCLVVYTDCSVTMSDLLVSLLSTSHRPSC